MKHAGGHAEERKRKGTTPADFNDNDIVLQRDKDSEPVAQELLVPEDEEVTSEIALQLSVEIGGHS